MKFTERLKELRLEKQFTQRELAARLGLTANCVCEWEKGRSEPSIDSLKGLAACLECTVDYLLGISDDFGNIVVSFSGEALNAEENEIVKNFRELPNDLRRRAAVYVKKLKELDEFERTE